MFDFSQLTSTVQSLLGDSATQTDTLLVAISGAGLDIEALQGLAPEQLAQLLAEHGVDLSAFAPEQLTSLATSLGLDEQLTGSIGNLLGHFKR